MRTLITFFFKEFESALRLAAIAVDSARIPAAGLNVRLSRIAKITRHHRQDRLREVLEFGRAFIKFSNGARLLLQRAFIAFIIRREQSRFQYLKHSEIQKISNIFGELNRAGLIKFKC